MDMFVSRDRNIEYRDAMIFFVRQKNISRCLGLPQQTQNICITFVQPRPNVFDVGPTLYKNYKNVLCLLGPPSE